MAYADYSVQDQGIVDALVGLKYKDLAGVEYQLPTDKNEFVQLLEAPYSKPPTSVLGGAYYAPTNKVKDFFSTIDVLDAQTLEKTGSGVYGTSTFQPLWKFANTHLTDFNVLQAGERWKAGQQFIADQRKRETLIETISGAVFAIFTLVGSYFAAPAAAGSTGSTVAAKGTIDTAYFGFEPSTLQSLGVSEFAAGPVTLTPQAASMFAGAPAVSFWDAAAGKATSSLETTTKSTLQTLSIAKPLGDAVAYLRNSFGDFGKGVVDLLTGNFKQAAINFGLVKQPVPVMGTPSLFGSSGGAGGSGLGINPNDNFGLSQISGLGWALIAGVILLLIVLVVRRK